MITSCPYSNCGSDASLLSRLRPWPSKHLNLRTQYYYFIANYSIFGKLPFLRLLLIWNLTLFLLISIFFEFISHLEIIYRKSNTCLKGYFDKCLITSLLVVNYIGIVRCKWLKWGVPEVNFKLTIWKHMKHIFSDIFVVIIILAHRLCTRYYQYSHIPNCYKKNNKKKKFNKK